MAKLVCQMILIFLVFFYIILFSPSILAAGAENLYDNNKDSIFTIFSINEENKEKSAVGSGVAVSKNLIATNCHVALAGNFLIIEINKEDLLGRLFYYNQEKDICLIEVVGATLQPVNIRPSETVKIGEEVFAIGNPEGRMKTISRGIISNKLKEDDIELLQTDASISQGSSGGGLFDANGNLIGITTKTLKEGENIAFAIPTELILAIINPKEKANAKTNHVNSEKYNVVYSNEIPPVTKNTSAEKYDELRRIGYYGEDQIALMKWNNRCFIGITGRHQGKPTSLAIWFPNKSNSLFIFSRVVNAENAIRYFKWTTETNNIKYQDSKSFLFFDKKLHSLPISSIDNIKQPVYLFVFNSDITEQLIDLDYFLGQFYGYTQTEGMTTVKFGLTGFTEALGAYNKSCK